MPKAAEEDVKAQEVEEEKDDEETTSKDDETEDDGDEESQEPSEIDQRFEALQTRLERAEAMASEAIDRAEHYKRAHDRLAGRWGRLKSKLSKGEEIHEDDEPEDRQDEIAQQKFDLVQQASETATLRFMMTHPGSEDGGEYEGEMARYVRGRVSDISEAKKSGDPTLVRTTIQRILSEAYAHARDVIDGDGRKRARGTREKRRERVREQKRVVTPIEGGTRPRTGAEPAVPGLKASDEEWSAYYKKVGRAGF
ncbi:MAG: hypothetical protein A3K68_05035 [Euryarchaeota archaeon RBG_16_68_13]|nr:MAG: hypothetical protein A3K68_05035 [Euryarchaeota archaeon RBG_16_68_13]